ncbi:AraC family transcriptional regulator [Sphingomonas sp. BK580]|uniref:helix-turn-helix transcriptional regulator n=1 Tax=Sphingomonas sp. BK580 TaxID=2586972 RepID=UPI001621649F|nr:AraC family transcriptional regulator [Sphingomonas sp. BK580]MBB3691905.1 AraC-like DNA-binding protein [Sphingomonas sp. BK580]
MPDPLAQIVSLLQPDLSYAKVVEAAGCWRIRRVENGFAFFFAALAGAVRLDIKGQQTLLIERGDFVLIPAACEFTSSSIDGAPASGRDSMPVEIRPNVFRLGDQMGEPDVRMLVGHCAFASPDAALLVSLLPSLIHARGEPRLTTLIQLAVEESRGERAGRDVVLARLMEVLFIEALRSSGPHCPSGILRGLGDERVAAAMRAIHERPTAAWDVPGLAKAAAMSRSAFFERFRRTVGMAPMEYLLHWRMVLAKRLLEDGKMAVAEIARQVGYSSASTFSVAFSRHVGATPTIYARQRSVADVSERATLAQPEPVSAFG